MYLNSRQLMLLFIIFLPSLVVMGLSSQVKEMVSNLFPKQESDSSGILERKVPIYLKIASQKATYEEIMEKVRLRERNGDWIAQKILYHAPVREKEDRQKQKRSSPTYRLQAIFAKRGVAIINGKMVRLYGRVDGAKVMQIEKNRLLIQTAKGEKWFYLFH